MCVATCKAGPWLCSVLTRVAMSGRSLMMPVTPQPIKYVLSTHNHGDHTGGHPEFIKTAEIIAHRNNRANMVRSKLAAPPRVVFSDQASVFLGGVEAQAIYMGRRH